jgi:hypothetical protein
MKKSPTRIGLIRVLLLASTMALSPSAFAQSAEKEAEPPADAPSPDDASVLTVSAAEANSSTTDARNALLEAQIAGLQSQLDALKAQVGKATPSWKGAPQSADADEGWSFKVRGRLMVDAAYAGKPDNFVASRNLGFNARVRRFRIGVEGGIPGGFGYKAEVDYANGAGRALSNALRSTMHSGIRGGWVYRLDSKRSTIFSASIPGCSRRIRLTPQSIIMAGSAQYGQPTRPMLETALCTLA